MMLEPIATIRLSEKIASHIVSLIDSGAYKQGDRLPAERDMTKRLGVCRNSVHQALRALEADGIVEIRNRSGVYVSAASTIQPPAVLQAIATPFDAREKIESEIAVLAAHHARNNHIDNLAESLHAMVACRDVRELATHDQYFHLTLAEASGNDALVRAVENVWLDTKKLHDAAKRTSSSRAFDCWSSVLLEHRRIFHAVKNHDPIAAKQAMQLHIFHARERLQGRLQ